MAGGSSTTWGIYQSKEIYWSTKAKDLQLKE
jgi:hypothetical protein